ncbi:Hypothetical protein SMAX5B_015338 [Scophthalmus maximus]|uniref:Uncharacterized protein n=1 Tax=Scophthalmus maximus TaxID=52904 RepID=A0A2U9C803_SCOMX|nr:Hypothetical protein SMAX5B_015338 [Scophthalmus maximus]
MCRSLQVRVASLPQLTAISAHRGRRDSCAEPVTVEGEMELQWRPVGARDPDTKSILGGDGVLQRELAFQGFGC